MSIDDLRVLYEEFRPEKELDYHNFGILSREEIQLIYDNFITHSLAEGKYLLLIITGKGKVVRPQIRNLLSKDKRVQAFRSAGYFLGKTGAFEVELKGGDHE